MKTAIVNLSTPKYEKGRVRLFNSLQNGIFDGDVITFVSEEQVGAPKHTDNPYAFKIYAIEKAREMGYTSILWLDASCYAIKNVQPIFDYLHKHGIFMENSGHWTSTWSNDGSLAYFGITREEAMIIPMVHGGFVGFDFTQKVSQEFFEKWKQSMLDGIFKGSWKDHRHDMTCASIIGYQMGLEKIYSPLSSPLRLGSGHFLAYIGDEYEEPQDTVIIYVTGA
mgnify:CR=1 FL=1